MKIRTTIFLILGLLTGIILFVLFNHHKKSGIIPVLGANEEPKKYNIIEAYNGNNLDFTPFGVNGTEAKELTNLLNEEIGEGEVDTTVTGTITSVAQYTQILIERLETALQDDPDMLNEYIVSNELDNSKLLGANDDDKNKVKTKEKKIKFKDLLNLITDAQVVNAE